MTEKKADGNKKIKKQLIKQYLAEIEQADAKNEELIVHNENLEKDFLNYKKTVKTFEFKLRELFKYLSKHESSYYQSLLEIESLKERNFALECEIRNQEERYNRLKNQFSYRIGKQIVSLKKNKNIFIFPKNLLDEYVEHKGNLNTVNMIQSSHFLRSPLSDMNKVTLPFRENILVSLNSNIDNILFDKSIQGCIRFTLFSVKPISLVSFQITVTSIKGSCKFIHQKQKLSLNEGQNVILNITASTERSLSLIDVISNEGYIVISFIKTKGVPSLICLSQLPETQENRQLTKVQENQQPSARSQILDIPQLKVKKAVLIEAEQIAKDSDKNTALSFLKKFLDEEFNATLNIFNANFVRENDALWLEYTNTYLDTFNVSSISLKKADKAVFHRITTQKKLKTVKRKIKISVIMPVFNAENTIKQSMNSILSQTWQNIELIVINDCSNDETLKIIEEIASEDARVKVINNPANVGAYVSKNLGLYIAVGDYITGHDADDWAHPQRLFNHMKAVQQEVIPPRASLTKMIRMDESGYFPLYRQTNFCLDGVLRTASITCMFEADFLRNTLGSWDCSRFGADSEIISRAKMIIGDEFKEYNQLSMICLDEPNSLTNNPIHGVQKGKGLSPSRIFYKKQWETWQAKLDASNVFLEFPHIKRNFAVPEGTEIPKKNILRAIKNVKKVYGIDI